MKQFKQIMKYTLLAFVLFGSLIALLLARWYTNRYGDTGFMSIISTFMTPWTGCSNNIGISWRLNALLPATIGTIILFPVFFYRGKRFTWKIKGKKIFPINRRVSNSIFAVFCIALIVVAMFMVRLPAFVRDYYFSDTQLYDQHYVDPEGKVTFPEQKRNLIYIYLESMETSFSSKKYGGAEKYDLIPELRELAEENVNFSHNDGLGGWPRVNHTTWTSAALVSQTSGLPLTMDLFSIKIGEFGGYLPGATTLQDILREEGYAQAFMCGSDATFGARREYFNLHGGESMQIYDLFTAQDEHLEGMDDEYMVWWGFEDSKLFKYAQDKIGDMAKNYEKTGQPFVFTMLTADTHHIDGYYDNKCCDDKYEEQYENVIACSSRQVDAFVKWIQAQPFYENTTIVVCGDHLSMDNQYFVRNIDEDYERHVYNCFINAPVDASRMKNRDFTSMDMFPTTLAAIGCEIEGDRLGLGTNLFSDRDTLAEELGYKYLNAQISKRSDYYIENFIEE